MGSVRVNSVEGFSGDLNYIGDREIFVDQKRVKEVVRMPIEEGIGIRDLV